MLFTKSDYENIICSVCEKNQTEECSKKIEYTSKDAIETLACTEYEFTGGKK